MAKKKRKDKELTRLRREVEVLRAQLAGGQKVSPAAETPKEPEPATTPLRQGSEGQAEARRRKETRKAPQASPPTQTVDPKFIKADLLKSGILTLIALGAIIALNFIF